MTWIKFIAGSLFGLGMFLYPLDGGDGFSTPVGMLTEWLEKLITANIPWFLYVLFLSRTLYDYLQLRIPEQQLPIAVWVIAFIGVAIGSARNFLPFSLDVALAVLPFFGFGLRMKTKSKPEPSFKLFAVCGVIWLLLVRFTTPHISNWTYLELAPRRYPFFPICYVGAVAGTLTFCEAGKFIGRFPIISKPIVLIGKDSLYLLMIHHLDIIWYSWWSMEDHQLLSAGKRIALDLCIFAVFMVMRELWARWRSAKSNTTNAQT